MRQPLSALLWTLSLSASALAFDIKALIFDGVESDRGQSFGQVSAEDARLLIQKRLGDQTGVLGRVSEETIQELEQLGGQGSGVLSQERPESPNQLFVLWEEVDVSDSKSKLALHANEFNIPDASTVWIDEFLHGSVSAETPGTKCSYEIVTDDGYDATLEFRALGRKCPAKSEISPSRAPSQKLSLEGLLQHVVPRYTTYAKNAALRITGKDGMRADSEAISKGSVVLSNLVTSSNQRTVMLLAPETIFAGSSAVLQRRRFEPKEQRLNDIPSTDGVSGGIEEYTFASKPKKDSKGDGLSTLLPVCYASNTTCNEWTHSCSGHGYCYHKNEKSKKKGGSGADSKDCYACKCVQTVVSRHPDGRPKKTIQWGGPACQKKDVSTPFFIFASLTVLMVLGVSGAIGLLFNMGEEELPSVLSAGVTAKTRK